MQKPGKFFFDWRYNFYSVLSFKGFTKPILHCARKKEAKERQFSRSKGLFLDIKEI